MILGSLVLGFAAWLCGLLGNWKRSAAWMYSSFSLCLLAALMPFYELRRYLYNGDYGGAEDIIGGILFGEVVLIAMTILLNGFALYRMKK